MKPYTLITAIQQIEATTQKKVMMIEFEDGSGYKFNCRFKGEREETFIDLSPKVQRMKRFNELMDINSSW